MNQLILVTMMILSCGIARGQDAKDIISKVIRAQSGLKTVSYQLERRDTLLTDDVRVMSGSAKIDVDGRDSILGFKFWARKDGESEERVYDGHVAYIVNNSDHTYTLSTSRSGILNVSYSGGGGHIIFPDLVKLDTSRVTGFGVTEDMEFYYLRLSYPDYTQENITNRFKIFTIDKKNMLPVAMKNHQESYGKVQDLYYHIKEIRINEPALAYDFLSLPFLNDYRVIIPEVQKIPVMSLKDQAAPPFNLASFKGDLVSSAGFKGKVVLIDLWEVWCGPCIASMPKVEALYEKYKDRGLLVYGITNDPRGLSAAKTMAQKKGFKLPMLIGDERFKKDYFISSTPLPMYILIDRSGKVRMLSGGFTNAIEEAVKKLLD